MTTISSIRDLIAIWPTRAILAEEINSSSENLTATAHQIHKWAGCGSIPAKYHRLIVELARARGGDVTAELIVELHAPSQNAKGVAA